MANNNLKTNFIYNILLTLSTYVAQLVVYPYVSRVLGVDNIGVIGFVNKSIDVFLIFSTLGVSTVGVREIAYSKNDKHKLNDVFSSLVSYIILSTLVVSAIYMICILFITKFNVYSNLFIIGLAKLLFSTFLIEWFYQGIEDFKFITIRSLSIKLLYIASVFLFVKDASDTNKYFTLTTLVIVLNGIINWITSRQYVNFHLSFHSTKDYHKPMLTFGMYQMLNAAFSTCNYMFLGFICTSTEVGYYYTAENFYFILLACISAFTRVMLPRMSSLLSENKKDEFKHLIKSSVSIVLSICFPIAIFGVVYASQIIQLFAGAGYEGAIVPMQIMMTLVLINGINQVLIVQIATPLKMDKEILIGTFVATIFALSINHYMIKIWGAIGCSVVLVVSVILANLYPICMLIKKQYINADLVKEFIHQAILSIPYFVIASIPLFLGCNNLYLIVLSGVLFVLYFICLPGRNLVKIIRNK